MAGVVQSPLLYSMVVAHRAPLHSRGKLIAICTTGVPLGNMAVPPLVVWLIAEFGWRGARVGLGLAILFCALPRSEAHTSELQSLMRISYAVFCLTKKMNKQTSRYQLIS